jgi:ATP-binding cassette subfamily B protein RaxB
MVAGWHGLHTDLVTLRSRFPLSLKGMSLPQLMACAEQFNFNSRAVRLDLDELPQLSLPCILHWDLNHFVVLVNINRKRAVIHDPAVGRRHVEINALNAHFTGVALELTPNAGFKPADERRRISLSALTGKITGLWHSLALVFALALALELFSLAGPMLNQWVVDEALASGDRELLNVIAAGFALMLAMQTAITLARGWTVMYLSTHLNLQWVANVFTHLLRLPVTWFEKRHLGDIVSRFGSISAIQHTLTTGFIEVILDGLFAILTLAMMLYYSMQLTAIVLAAVAVYTLLRALFYQPLREANEEALVLDAREQSCFLETLRGVQVIKLYGRELDRRNRWFNLAVDSANRTIRTEKFMLWFTIANTAVFGLEGLMILWLGAGKVIAGSFTTGMLFAFTAYGNQLGGRLSALINKFFEFRLLSLHAERLADIVLEAPEPDGHADLPAQRLPARLELTGIGFRYADQEPWVIRNLSLTIEPGESLAITGPSGCGKTTLVKLILGILQPVEGEIRYGGHPLSRLGPAALRQVMGAVMQDDHLLAGSLADNICFFDPQPDLARIESCARAAAVHEDISAMPMGYQTLAGDMGTTLSGGQRQRLFLARALYKQPHILVLDEATSHLDVEREQQVSGAISALNITRICIAHRPETIAMSRRVLRMENGAIGRDERSDHIPFSGQPGAEPLHPAAPRSA